MLMTSLDSVLMQQSFSRYTRFDLVSGAIDI